MVRYTTPTFEFRIKSDIIDLNDARNIYVTFYQGGKGITIDEEQLSIESPNSIKVWMDQETSSELYPGVAEVQINWTYLDSNGRLQRVATKIRRVDISKNLLEEVVD